MNSSHVHTVGTWMEAPGDRARPGPRKFQWRRHLIPPPSQLQGIPTDVCLCSSPTGLGPAWAPAITRGSVQAHFLEADDVFMAGRARPAGIWVLAQSDS